MPERRPPSVELRIEREPGGRVRSIPLSPSARAALAATGLALLGALLTLAAITPSALAAIRQRREFDLQLGRRAQLGERLQALVGELGEVEDGLRRLEAEAARAAGIYGLPVAPAPPPAAASAPPTAAHQGTIFAATVVRGERLAHEMTTRFERLDAELSALADFEAREIALVRSLPLGRPLVGELTIATSGFGHRRSPAGGAELEFHPGLDLSAPAGTSVIAPADGVVLWAGDAPPNAGPAWWRLGRLVVVRHGDRFLTVAGHCARTKVMRGARVRTGQVLAEVGSSGWAAAPQLHYEVRRRDPDGTWRAIDPQLFLAPAGAVSVAEAGVGGPSPPPLPGAFRP
jgi:murein DD-endopeptidase MepM/ murein hydrolase activator NlpD